MPSFPTGKFVGTEIESQMRDDLVEFQSPISRISDRTLSPGKERTMEAFSNEKRQCLIG